MPKGDGHKKPRHWRRAGESALRACRLRTDSVLKTMSATYPVPEGAVTLHQVELLTPHFGAATVVIVVPIGITMMALEAGEICVRSWRLAVFTSSVTTAELEVQAGLTVRVAVLVAVLVAVRIAVFLAVQMAALGFVAVAGRTAPVRVAGIVVAVSITGTAVSVSLSVAPGKSGTVPTAAVADGDGAPKPQPVMVHSGPPLKISSSMVTVPE